MAHLISFFFPFLIFFIVLTSLFLGCGYLLSLWTVLDLFQGMVVSIGSAAVTFLGASASIYIVNALERDAARQRIADHDWGEWDEEEGEPAEGVVWSEASEPTSRRERRAMANDPCFCGSGRKYKNCHGREKKG